MRDYMANVVAFVVGMAVSSVVIFLVEMIGHKIYPVNFDFNDKEALKRAVKEMPLGAFFMVELAYILGSLAGGFVTAKIAASYHVYLALGVGALLTVFGFQNQMAIPHPLWFAVLTTVTYIPLSYVGATVFGNA